MGDSRTDYETFRVNMSRSQSIADGMASMSADATLMSGETRINGNGDVLVSVPFACKFTEKPLFYFGAEVIQTSDLVKGAYPTLSAMVCGWTTEERGGSSTVAPTSRAYTGATIAVVTQGTPQSKFVLHWHFSGDAYAGPAGSL